MTTLPEWVDQVKRIWVTIGVFITTLGINIPDFIPEGFFGDTFISMVITALGSIIAIVQFFRADIDPGIVPAPDAGVSAMTADAVDKSVLRSFKYNPFKLRLRKSVA